MKLTKREKIAWIKRAINHAETFKRSDAYGMCFWFCETSPNDGIDYIYIRENLFPSIGIKKPRGADDWWFPRDEEGRATRLRIMRAALKRLQTKSK